MIRIFPSKNKNYSSSPKPKEIELTKVKNMIFSDLTPESIIFHSSPLFVLLFGTSDISNRNQEK